MNRCETDPIHAPGAVQSFGAVVICDPQTLSILQCSENIGQFHAGFAQEALGKKLHELCPEILRVAPEDDTFETGSAIVSRHLRDGLSVYEFEPKPASDLEKISQQLRRSLRMIQATWTLQTLFQQTTHELQRLLDYDRVMVYRFHADYHGEVIAESVKEGVESYMGFHYPAGDIPAPARKVFLENWLRMIPDSDTAPSRLIPEINPVTGRTTDLGTALLRNTASSHIQYLRNMKVKATLTISLLSEGKLWGLVACHHLTPKYLDPNWRWASESVGRMVSGRIRDIEGVVKEDNRNRLRVLQRNAAMNLQNSDDMARALTEKSPTVLDILDSTDSAAALFLDGRWTTLGTVPTETQLDQLVTWLEKEHGFQSIFHTSYLSSIYAGGVDMQAIGSGLLAISVPQSARSYILVFRPEVRRTIRWAGKDEVTATPDGRIHPRNSFAEWIESVRGHSIPWQSWELEAAEDLRDTLISLDLRRQFAREHKALAQAEQAIANRDELMGVFSSDLKNPLASILAATKLLAENFGENQLVREKEFESISSSAKFIDELIGDVLAVTNNDTGKAIKFKKSENLKTIVADLFTELEPKAQEAKINLQLRDETRDCNVICDRFRISRVIRKLLENSIKFTPPGGQIEFKLLRGPKSVVEVSVKDNGPGISSEHHLSLFEALASGKRHARCGTNLHLAISKSIVQAHGGTIWLKSDVGQGAEFGFTLPAESPAPAKD